MTTVADTELVERARLRDARAFGELVERHQRLVVGVALARCGNLALAEDVAQEAFVTAWHDLARLRESARVAPWIAGIARNLAAAASRTQLRRAAATLPEAAPVPTPSDVAIDREDRELLAHALRDLPDAHREVLVLYYLEGESIAAIAAALGASEDVVEQRLSRGRRGLRDGVASRVEAALTRVRGRPSLRAGVIAALAGGTRKAAASSAAGKVLATMTISKVLIGAAAVAVASSAIWFGTRAHGADARASAMPPSAGGPALAPASSPHVRRVDPQARAQLLEQIRQAEARLAQAASAPPAPAPHSSSSAPPSLPEADLDKDYIRGAVRAVLPMLTECYEHALETTPTLGGKVVVEFTIEGEPGVGGVVSDSSIDEATSTLTDPDVRECIAQTMYTLEIDPPIGGGKVQVTYPFLFAPAPSQ